MGTITLSQRYRRSGRRYRRVTWECAQTAVILCDFWDQHWCAGANRRVAALVPQVVAFLDDARGRGMRIVHAPSDTLETYAGTPQRRRAQEAPPVEPAPLPNRWHPLDPTKEPPLPIDDSDGGCDDDPPCPTSWAWKAQHPAVPIGPDDAITDDGEELWRLFHQWGIRHVLILGVHTNMCVLGRSFGIRRLVGLGYDIALVRDLTDTMYNPRRAPFVPHEQGTALVIEHIERYWCPTITSAALCGGESRSAGPSNS